MFCALYKAKITIKVTFVIEFPFLLAWAYSSDVVRSVFKNAGIRAAQKSDVDCSHYLISLRLTSIVCRQ